VTGVFLLDWAIMTVSLFNTVLLLWLGLTVLLNAERPTWGIWLAGGGLLLGGAFFVSHSAILGHGLETASRGMDFWWHMGWIPVVASPFAWYGLMLWYAGFWSERPTELRRRHRPWFLTTTMLAITLVGLLIFANPLPTYWQVAQLSLSTTLSVGGIPLLILVYPFYILLCIGLSLDVLRRPNPSARLMGDLARRRARPWLMGASIVLLLVSLLVAWVMVWIVLNARQRSVPAITTDMALTVAWFDLIIAGLIGAAVILLGRAIVTYEVFTGKTLPRQGFFRHWRRAVFLAVGYGIVVGWSITIQLRPIYSLLLTVLLMVAFYALLSWRSFADRERTIEHLRPFVASQRLYERLLAPSPISDVDEVDIQAPFHALCEDLLGARTASLIALGPLAPLIGPPLVYPGKDTTSLSLADVMQTAEIPAQFDSPQTIYVPLDLGRTEPGWAVPLWSERGLIGVLLLGEKRDGGLYTQEEMEIARATGERLIDVQASAEMASRLMALQRQQLAESQLLDRRTRRVLHDDVLPRLHAAMLMLSGEPSPTDSPSPDVVALLGDLHREIADLLHDMPAAIVPEIARLGLFATLRQTVTYELGSAFDQVTWEITPEAEEKAQAIPSFVTEVLFYAAREAIRNAARHGRSPQSSDALHLCISGKWDDPLAGAKQACVAYSGLQIIIEDNGVGLGSGKHPDDDGGHGLALHTTMMAIVGGTLELESIPGQHTRVVLTLPQEAW
jgi:signal transduction histidine kinase